MAGILAVGAYLPRLRLQRDAVAAAHAWFNPGLQALARGERTMAAWDEDVITMSLEAARDCLAGVDRVRVGRLVLASTSHPFADRQNAVVVKEALNLPDDVGCQDAGGGQRAATSALLNALHAAKGGAGDILCLAAEKRAARPGSELELLGGDGAVGVLVGEGEAAAELLAGHSVSIDFVDHFRAEGRPFDYGWEARWVRDEGFGKIAPRAVTAALAAAGVPAAEVAHFIMGAPMPGVHAAVARGCGIRPEAVAEPLSGVVGDCGTAQPLILLAHALERARAGEVLVVVGFGQGCDVLVFRATGRTAVAGLGVSGWLARRRPEANYFKYLAFNGHLQLEQGMRAELDQKTALTALYRNRKAVMGLVGGRCAETGTVQFPKSEIDVSPNRRATRTQEDYPLADRRARIVTFTADRLTYSPDPPAWYGAIEFDEGGRMTVEFADVEPHEVEVGAATRMMFRIKAFDAQRGFTKYFWKAVPDYRATGRGEGA